MRGKATPRSGRSRGWLHEENYWSRVYIGGSGLGSCPAEQSCFDLEKGIGSPLYTCGNEGFLDNQSSSGSMPVVEGKVYSSNDFESNSPSDGCIRGLCQFVFRSGPKFTLPKSPSISRKSLSLSASHSCNRSAIATVLFCRASISGVIPYLSAGLYGYRGGVCAQCVCGAVCDFEAEGGRTR